MSTDGLIALVVDDEVPALSELSYLLGRDERIGEVVTAASGTEALRVLDERDVDVVFSDISMPGLDGMALARVISRFAVRPQIVFVTAHDKHAVDAFALAATDYVMKPVRPERLAEAVRRVVAKRAEGGPQAGGPGSAPAAAGSGGDPRATDLVTGAAPARPGGFAGAVSHSGLATPGHLGHPGHPGQARQPGQPAHSGHPGLPGGGASLGAPLPGSPTSPVDDETIPVELGGVTRFITRSQIRYAQAHGDYARLHTDSGSHLVRIPLSVLEETWGPHGFVRIHRSTLVALPHVTEVRMDRGRCSVVIGTTELQVSRRHTKELRDTLLRRPIGGRAATGSTSASR